MANPHRRQRHPTHHPTTTLRPRPQTDTTPTIQRRQDKSGTLHTTRHNEVGNGKNADKIRVCENTDRIENAAWVRGGENTDWIENAAWVRDGENIAWARGGALVRVADADWRCWTPGIRKTATCHG
jgi:hypothetical protein